MFFQVLEGHFNEIMEREEDLCLTRIKICRECPLMTDSRIGKVCSNRKYLNIETGKASNFPCESCIQGCGCRLEAKTRVADAHCPANKW